MNNVAAVRGDFAISSNSMYVIQYSLTRPGKKSYWDDHSKKESIV